MTESNNRQDPIRRYIRRDAAQARDDRLEIRDYPGRTATSHSVPRWVSVPRKQQRTLMRHCAGSRRLWESVTSRTLGQRLGPDKPDQGDRE